MSHPNADSPLNCDCGNLIRANDLTAYRSLGEFYTKMYAIPVDIL